MTNKTPLLIFCFLAFLSAGLGAQPYTMRRLEVENGLSQNMVYCIIQDRSDFIWIGTQNGLNRYDGSSFRIFKKSSGGGLRNDGICSLAQDPEGNIWVGTTLGLQIFDPVSESFRMIPIHDATGNAVEGIVRDIEFGTEGEAYVAIADTCLVKIDKGGIPSQLSLADAGKGIRIRDLFTDGEGNLWIASFGGGLMELPGGSPDRARSFPYGSAADRMFTKIAGKDNETLLLGTVDQGMLEFSIRTRTYSPVSGFGRDEVHFVHDIMVSSEGSIWVGAENGLHIKDASGITRLTHSSSMPDSISDNAVFCISEDSEGGVWIGTYFGGVNYYSRYSSMFRKYSPLPEEGHLRGKNISEFCPTGDGRIWIGTEDAGLHRFDPKDGKFETGFIPAGNIHALSIIDGNLWAGSYGEGLFILGRDGRLIRRHILPAEGGSPGDNSIYSIFKDISGVVWIGTESGLFTYDGKNGTFSRAAGDLIFRQVNDIVQDFEGKLWFATMGQGIFRYNPETGVWLSVPGADPFTTCILEDSEHNLWFGTEDSGIVFYSHASNDFERRWSEEDGLPNNMIYMLLEDSGGGIWGSTNRGLFHISPYRDKVQRFDHHSGLVCDQFNFKSGMKASDGTIYFGGVKGFVSFSPKEFNLPAKKAKIVFNRFMLYNREVAPGAKNSPLGKSIIFEDEISLKPSERMFSIGFADLDYSFSDIKTYQYRLVGHDREWIDIEHSHLLSFSNLQPGHYRLEVRANPINSFPGDTVKGIDIRILPPWYLTPVAVVIEVLLVLALLSLGVSLLVKRIRKHNQEVVLRELERRRAAASSADMKFLDRVAGVMDEYLSDPDFNVNMMADLLHMSRSTLYRKMKNLTDAAGNDYIKQYRLKKAAKLLADKNLPVAEIASLTGFSSVSYFSRCFRSFYGVSPKDYKGDQNK